MKITSAEFVKSAFAEEHWTTDGLPEVAFLGRSNVGKSSLLNSLLQRKGLARTSNTPGRTQSLNYFLINKRFYFVDLPGYGYARVSKAMRSSWGKMAEDYLAKREQLVLCIQLIDSRHEPTEQDRQLFEWLRHYGKTQLIVATKSDKLSSNELRKSIEKIGNILPGVSTVSYSAVTGRGREEVWRAIDEATKI
ncbi:MAG TPA: ribosome biogenesis GTP-binding protein YihA/YsxC [Pyrinomonadaceae bacterium]|jgi:GTP-binding protein